MGDQRMMSFGFSGSPPPFWQIKYDDDDDVVVCIAEESLQSATRPTAWNLLTSRCQGVIEFTENLTARNPFAFVVRNLLLKSTEVIWPVSRSVNVGVMHWLSLSGMWL